MIQHECGCKKCNHKSCTRKVPIFSNLDDIELNYVANLIIRKSYSKGDLIIMEKDKLESLVIINEGRVKAFRYTQAGKEQILYIFSEGDFFGERNLLKNQETAYNVEALEDTTICSINKKDFQELLREHPDIGLKIMEELCSRIERFENTIQNMGTNNMEARVSSILLEFTKKYGEENKKGVLVELPLSREGIANYIGLTRETVSRKLSLLQDEGIIEMIGNKKILIVNKKALEQSIESF